MEVKVSSRREVIEGRLKKGKRLGEEEESGR